MRLARAQGERVGRKIGMGLLSPMPKEIVSNIQPNALFLYENIFKKKFSCRLFSTARCLECKFNGEYHVVPMILGMRLLAVYLILLSSVSTVLSQSATK